MAFGQSVKDDQAKRAAKAESGAETTFEWPWIPLNNGVRKVRLLPELDERGELVLVPATDRAGKVIKGKMVPVTATEVRFTEIWWKFMVDGQEKPRRIFVDWQNPFDNPFWNEIAKPTDKGSDARKAIKQRFAMNVVDKSNIILNKDGYPVYADENNVYFFTAAGKRGEVVSGTPGLLNRIRVLEGSAGQPNGKHFFQQFVDMIGVTEDGEGAVRDLHEFDIMIKITGQGVETRRTARPAANFAPLPDSLIFAPRYNLVDWAKPWPNDAIHDLLSGKDFNEVVEQYGVKVYPELMAVRHEETDAGDKPVKAKSKKVAAKEESEEEDLFE